MHADMQQAVPARLLQPPNAQGELAASTCAWTHQNVSLTLQQWADYAAHMCVAARTPSSYARSNVPVATHHKMHAELHEARACIVRTTEHARM